MSCQIPGRVVRLAKAESFGYCLPFLYCTQTILSTVRAHAINSKARARENAYSSRRAYSTFQPKRMPKTGSIFEEDGILRKMTEPFGTGNGDEAPKARRSTLTNAEQAAFDAIWTESDKRQQKSIDNDIAEADGARDNLNEIFEHAIQQIERRERSDAERAARDRSYFREMKTRPVLEAFRDDSLLDMFSTKLSQPGKEKMDESDARVLAACNQHRKLVAKMLNAAKSDMEVWDVLESEVFSMVEQLQHHLTQQEKAEKRQRKPRKKEESKGGSGVVSNNDEPQEPKGVASQKAFSPLLNGTNALPTNAILTNLQANYAYYNILALRIWRRHHPTSTSALQLLPRIKSLGPISYVLGASTSLYNEVLFVKWTHFNDLHGVADLVNEMGNQGIEPNGLTLSFLRFISRTRNADLAGQRGKVLQSWWNMRAVNDGWQRIKNIALQVQADVFKREREEQQAQQAQQAQQEQSHAETEDDESWTANMQNAMDEEEDKAGKTPEPSLKPSFRISRVSMKADTSWVRKQKIRKIAPDLDTNFFEVRRNRSEGRSKSTN